MPSAAGSALKSASGPSAETARFERDGVEGFRDRGRLEGSAAAGSWRSPGSCGARASGERLGRPAPERGFDGAPPTPVDRRPGALYGGMQRLPYPLDLGPKRVELRQDAEARRPGPGVPVSVGLESLARRSSSAASLSPAASRRPLVDRGFRRTWAMTASRRRSRPDLLADVEQQQLVSSRRVAHPVAPR